MSWPRFARDDLFLHRGMAARRGPGGRRCGFCLMLCDIREVFFLSVSYTSAAPYEYRGGFGGGKGRWIWVSLRKSLNLFNAGRAEKDAEFLIFKPPISLELLI